MINAAYQNWSERFAATTFNSLDRYERVTAKHLVVGGECFMLEFCLHTQVRLSVLFETIDGHADLMAVSTRASLVPVSASPGQVRSVYAIRDAREFYRKLRSSGFTPLPLVSLKETA